MSTVSESNDQQKNTHGEDKEEDNTSVTPTMKSSNLGEKKGSHQKTTNGNAGYPFFGYKDYCRQEDPDTLVPLTLPGRVPNFVAKMHAILSRSDLADIVAWLPHGRSWRVLKPREFEVKVLPTIFDHAKYSSFIRQANGWGFRRLSQGKDRNSYYHPRFLRGLPHLCKPMKRPGVREKKALPSSEEPDLYEISRRCPLPEDTDKTVLDESMIMLDTTIQEGPRARMPIYTGALTNDRHATSINSVSDKGNLLLAMSSTSWTTPRDQETLYSFSQSLAETEKLVSVRNGAAAKPAPLELPRDYYPRNQMLPSNPIRHTVAAAMASHRQSSIPAFLAGHSSWMERQHANTNSLSSTLLLQGRMEQERSTLAVLAAANQLAVNKAVSMTSPSFAAGFAAATAYSQRQFETLLGQMPQGDTTTNKSSTANRASASAAATSMASFGRGLMQIPPNGR